MNSIGIPATAAMPPSKRYVVRQPKSSNRKTVSSGTNDEAIPVEQSVTARDRPRLALQRLVTAAIQTAGLMNRLDRRGDERSEESTAELQSLMRTLESVFCLKKITQKPT